MTSVTAPPVYSEAHREAPTGFGWIYTEGDPALMLFTAAVERFGMTFPRGARILELGCAETDWLERMDRLNQDFVLTGVDVRHHARTYGSPPQSSKRILEGDACNPDLFEPESFDRVVLLGALEHFGLGFYGDSVQEDGDTRTMQNVARWLVLGGFVYFDVPCNPTFSVAPNRCFRTYSPQAVTERLIVPGLREIARGYSDCEPRAGTWVEEPTSAQVPYWFCAVVAEKA